MGFDLFDELIIEVDGDSTVGATVTLRPVPLDRFAELAAMVGSGLFPDGPPTLGPWYDPGDLARSARRTIAYHCTALDEVSPRRWSLPLGVFVADELVGVQSLDGADFVTSREAATGSFLAPAWRGRHIGRTARHGIVAAAFEELGAEWVTSAAWQGNPASQRVSEALGYRHDGLQVDVVRGEQMVLTRFRLHRDDWAASAARPAVTCHGFDGFRDRIGL